ncbi:hypothetical protein M3Y99_00491700 [Aphelenchoides fujianensis]|nr:hypothetical protein M3Y99_00491700 [Aphelenchoides fujianensis]
MLRLRKSLLWSPSGQSCTASSATRTVSAPPGYGFGCLNVSKQQRFEPPVNGEKATAPSNRVRFYGNLQNGMSI